MTTTTQLIIPFEENKTQPLPHLFNLLISRNHFSMQDVPDKVREFRNEKDLYFDIPTDQLPQLVTQLADLGFIFKPESLHSLIKP